MESFAKNRNVLRWLLIAAGISFFIALVTFAYVGLFSRYIADDYCITAVAIQKGWLGSMLDWYGRFSGRFSFFLLINLAEYPGVITSALSPLFLLLIWQVGATWALAQFNFLAKVERPYPVAFLLAEIVVLTTVDGTPNLFESLYWQTGSFTYTLPIVLIVPYIGMLGLVLREPKRAPSVWILTGGAAVMFIAGGLSETNVPMQIVGCGLGLAIALSRWGRRIRPLVPLLNVGFLASLFASGIIVLAPGNFGRARFFQPVATGIDFLFGLVKATAKFGIISVLHGSLSELIAFIFSALVAFTVYPLGADSASSFSLKRTFIIGGGAVLGGIILIVAGLAPSALVFRTAPPPRALIIPRFVVIVVLAFCGYLVGVAARADWLKRQGKIPRVIPAGVVAVAVALLFFGPLKSTSELASYVPEAQAFATGWDARDSELRSAKAQGIKEIAVNALTYPSALGKFEPDVLPTAPANRCMANYYGFDSISAKQ